MLLYNTLLYYTVDQTHAFCSLSIVFPHALFPTTGIGIKPILAVAISEENHLC